MIANESSHMLRQFHLSKKAIAPSLFRLAFPPERRLLAFKLSEALLSIDAFASVQRSNAAVNLGAKPCELGGAFFQQSQRLRCRQCSHLTAQYHRNQSLSRPSTHFLLKMFDTHGKYI